MMFPCFGYPNFLLTLIDLKVNNTKAKTVKDVCLRQSVLFLYKAAIS